MSYESNCVRTAAALIRTMGHCQGANSRDERGRVTAASGQRSRSLSIYGALTRAFNCSDVELQTGNRHADVWATVTQAAAERLKEMGLGARVGQHPVFALNDLPGFNAAAAQEFLGSVAERLEKVQTHLKNGAAT